MENVEKRMRAGLLSLFLAFPLVAQALGVGNIELKSALNEPLNADIALLSVSPEDLDSLTVVLAGEDIFQRMGIERSEFLSDLRFRIVERAAGQFVINVSSPGPVKEPFLNFLIEIDWRNGRLLREFTVLVDPPVTLEEEARPVVRTPEVEPAPAQLPPISETPPAEVPLDEVDQLLEQLTTPAEDAGAAGAAVMAEEEEAAAPAEPIPALSGSLDYGPVRSGDILGYIAGMLQPNNQVTKEQMMVALFRQNPDAFFGDSVSMLKEGSVLRIADTSTVAEISVEEAVAELARHHQVWLAYKREQQAARAVAAESAGRQPLGAGEGQEVAVVEGEEPLLELVTPEQAPSEAEQAGAEQVASQEELARLNNELALASEAVEAARRENQELQGRLGSLEEQLGAMRDLIRLKDQELAMLREQTGLEEGEVTTEGGIIGMDSLLVEGETAEEETWLEMLLRDRFALGTAVAIAVLALSLLFLMGRGRKGGKEGEGAPIAELPEAQAEPLESGEERMAAAVDTGLEPLTELATPSELAVEETEDVFAAEELGLEGEEMDPLAEADVYLAYGKYDKAEDLVRSAMNQVPDRHELKLKMLEIYYLTRNRDAFESLAELLYAAIGGGEHPLWEQARIMGQEFLPDNPLFASEASVEEEDKGGDAVFLDENSLAQPAVPLEEPTFAEEAEALTAAEQEVLAGLAEEEEKLPTIGEEIDLTQAATMPSLGDMETATDLAEAELAGEGLSALTEEVMPGMAEKAPSMTEVETPTAALEEEIAVGETPQSLVEESVEGLDERLSEMVGESIPGEEEPASDRSQAAMAPEQEKPSQGSVTEEFLDREQLAESATQVEVDEHSMFLLDDQVGTKMDLAKAYIEMGDNDGARDLLQEVMEEGDERQRQQAQALLESMDTSDPTLH